MWFSRIAEVVIASRGSMPAAAIAAFVGANTVTNVVGLSTARLNPNVVRSWVNEDRSGEDSKTVSGVAGQLPLPNLADTSGARVLARPPTYEPGELLAP